MIAKILSSAQHSNSAYTAAAPTMPREITERPQSLLAQLWGTAKQHGAAGGHRARGNNRLLIKSYSHRTHPCTRKIPENDKMKSKSCEHYYGRRNIHIAARDSSTHAPFTCSAGVPAAVISTSISTTPLDAILRLFASSGQDSINSGNSFIQEDVRMP